MFPFREETTSTLERTEKREALKPGDTARGASLENWFGRTDNVGRRETAAIASSNTV
ncbi:MAG: hypothetical protein SGJ27_12765 [Candidatus Melainabacteria bacterium]|nr:hypothetical protein [Candidatus Melainabacteria bacterium]